MITLTTHERDILERTGEAQIRRALDPQPPKGWHYIGESKSRPGKFMFSNQTQTDFGLVDLDNMSMFPTDSPFGKPGDVLWYKEEWAAIWKADDPCGCQVAELCGACPEHDTIEYKADTKDKFPGGWPDNFDEEEGIDPDCPLWQPADTMPEWASRLRFKVLDMRVKKMDGVWGFVGYAEVVK